MKASLWLSELLVILKEIPSKKLRFKALIALVYQPILSLYQLSKLFIVTQESRRSRVSFLNVVNLNLPERNEKRS